MDITEAMERAQLALQQFFGFEKFRPGQKNVLVNILQKQNVVAIMPTGGGKSLLYQLPAMLLDGTVLVISPLISLMKDQVDALRDRKIEAAFINSSLGISERRNVTRAMQLGCYRLVYIAPERLQNQEFVEILKQTKISLLAVDEAHCISQWGHDFRPDYLKIKEIRELLQIPQTLAFTATATKEVRTEIATKLGLTQWKDHIEGFDRNNLFFQVAQASSQNDKIAKILEIYQKMGCTSGIVYASTRKNVELVTKKLTQANISVASYHAGLSDALREKVQNEFMQDKISLVVATNAFGMGIDKPDIRFVVHFDIPSDIESYYQEIGRAGRDGKDSHCCLLFNFADTRIPRFFIEEAHPSASLVFRIWEYVSAEQIIPHVEEIARDFPSVSTMGIRYSLNFLERAGLIGKATQGFYVSVPSPEGMANLKTILQQDAQRKSHDDKKLESMIRYCYHTGCRRNWILDYFGDHRAHAQCHACDNCQKSDLLQEITGDPLVEILKALSAVARLNGRLGKVRLAQVLIGSRSKDILNWKLDKIPTYGALKDFSQNDACQLLENLVTARYLQVRLKDSKYPVLSLTPGGYEVMMRKEPCYLPKELLPPFSTQINKEKKKSKKTKEKKKIGEIDKVLYQKLVNLRKQKADEIGKPAFVVFHNATLEELAASKPKNIEEIKRISGIGALKLERYGKEFLQVINEKETAEQI